MLFTFLAYSQSNCEQIKFYGRFCLDMAWSPKLFYLYDSPDKNKKAYARFEQYNKEIANNSYALASKITFLKSGQSEDNKSVVEFAREGHGLVGLECSNDSMWFKVSLDRTKSINAPFAWVNREEFENAGGTVVWWNQYYNRKGDLYFRCDSARKFYSMPSLKNRIYPLNGKNNYDYSMTSIQVVDDWMQIYLFIPSMFGVEDSVATQMHFDKPKKMWVKYLDKNGSPLVTELFE